MSPIARRPEESLGDDAAALTDAETGLPNGLHFSVVYRVIFAAGTRGFPVTLLFLQPRGLDDEPGSHAEFAELLQGITRRMDLLARLDRSRFAVLLLGCNIHGGRVAADRLLQTLSPWLESRGCTIAMGAAALQPEMTSRAELTALAEAALKAASESPGSAVETRP